MNVAAPGLDASWNAGLAVGFEEGMLWGREIVFTYGPLGWLNSNAAWFADLTVLAFVYRASLYVAFCVALVWGLRRLLGLLPAVLIAYAMIAVLPLIEEAIVLALLVSIWALGAEQRERAIHLLVFGGATYAALEVLIKFSVGPVVAVFFLLALLGLRARWWQVGAYLGLLAAEVLALWLLTGQSLGQVPDFLRNTYEIVSGFSESMVTTTDVEPWQVTAATIAAAATAVGLLAASTQASYRDSRARWCGIALVGLASFTVFKEGVVRTDAGHLSLFFSTAAVICIAIPWGRARRWWMVAALLAIVAMSWPVRPDNQGNRLDPVANVEHAADQLQILASTARREELVEFGKGALRATYDLEPETLAALRGHTVAIEPWEIGVAWAYDLDWEPLPVIQNYSAYTAALDQLNAEALTAPDGPERLLRENVGLVFPEFPTRGLDGRFPGWDPPLQARTALCNFEIVHASARWQVLARSGDRCGPSRPLGTVGAEPGEEVEVPAPGPHEVIWAEVGGVEVGGFERLYTSLVHSRTRHAIVNGERSYRLIPGTAANGLMLRSSNGIGSSGAFAQIPQARTIAIDGVNGPVRFEFFAMPVRSLRSFR